MGSCGEFSLTLLKCGCMKMKSIKLRFTGEYSNTLDQKNRVNVPAKFRKALDPINNRTFVITRGFDKCLVLYPVLEWNKVEEQLSSLSSITERNRDFVRSVSRYASYLQYDSQGRITIPDSLKEFSNINKEIILIGMIKKIELWSPDEINEDTPKKDKQSFDDLADVISF